MRCPMWMSIGCIWRAARLTGVLFGIGRHHNFTTRPMMPSTVAMPIHQANKVAPAAPRRSSLWVPRGTSIQSAVNRTMPAAAAATAAQRN
jgi:hypothetical protein